MRPVARTAAWLAWLLAATSAAADPQTVIEVAGPPAAGVFHHLGAAGRRALAVSDAQVAVAWEDDHGGAPHAYVAIKADDAAAFGAPIRASTTAEAYEPALVYAGHGFFALAYEGDGQIRLQSVDARGVRASTPIGGTPARQATLAAGAGEVHVAWSEKRAGGAWNVRHASYTIGPDGELRVLRPAAWVNVQPVPADQSYPALAVTPAAGVVLAWEDRQAGHTRIVVSHRAPDAAQFAPARGLNRWNRPAASYDKGSGAMRPALASAGNRVLAVWLDKRGRVESAYDVYAAFSHDGGVSFGEDSEVADGFGRGQPQRNPVPLLFDDGRAAVVWDDPRDGTRDLWFSSFDGKAWSDDRQVAGAAGPGEQAHAAAAADTRGRAHLAWVDRATDAAPGRILYTVIAAP